MESLVASTVDSWSDPCAQLPMPLQDGLGALTPSASSAVSQEVLPGAIGPDPGPRDRLGERLELEREHDGVSSITSPAPRGAEEPAVWNVEYSAEHKACVRTKAGSRDRREEWSTWQNPEAESAEIAPMVAVWEDGFSWQCTDFLVGDFMADKAIAVTRKATGAKAKEIGSLYQGCNREFKIRVWVKPENGTPLTVLGIKPNNGPGSWKQKCQVTTKSANGDLKLAEKVLIAVAAKLAANEITTDELMGTRDTILSEAGRPTFTK